MLASNTTQTDIVNFTIYDFGFVIDHIKRLALQLSIKEAAIMRNMNAQVRDTFDAARMWWWQTSLWRSLL